MHDPSEKITSPLTYFGVYIALLGFTLTTTLIAFIDLGVWSMVIALTIAAMKALLVILFFTDALHNHRLKSRALLRWPCLAAHPDCAHSCGLCNARLDSFPCR